jgi:ribosomal protein S18 acetylase RimI-like enzyme
MTQQMPVPLGSALPPLRPGDIGEAVRIYQAAFPVSGLGALGPRVLRAYFHWLLSGPQAAGSFAACEGERLIGFAFLTQGNPQPPFMRKHWPLLAWSIARRPWLLRKVRLGSLFGRFLRRRAPVADRQPAAPVARSAGPSLTLFLIGVDPLYQKRGIGALLLNNCEALARRKTCASMGLNVELSNDRAIAVYQRNGWEKVIENGDWKGRMQKTLEPPIEAV